VRNIPIFRDPAVILIDQLKEIYMDAELDAVDTANWYPKVNRKDLQARPQSDRCRYRRPGFVAFYVIGGLLLSIALRPRILRGVAA
jgi:hypothetical protein